MWEIKYGARKKLLKIQIIYMGLDTSQKRNRQSREKQILGRGNQDKSLEKKKCKAMIFEKQSVNTCKRIRQGAKVR